MIKELPLAAKDWSYEETKHKRTKMNELVARLRDDGYSAESGAFTVMREAADAIESQEKKIAELEREIAGYKTLTMQLAKAEESACIEAFYADEDRKKAETTLSERNDELLRSINANDHLKADLRECMAHADAMQAFIDDEEGGTTTTLAYSQ